MPLWVFMWIIIKRKSKFSLSMSWSSHHCEFGSFTHFRNKSSSNRSGFATEVPDTSIANLSSPTQFSLQKLVFILMIGEMVHSIKKFMVRSSHSILGYDFSLLSLSTICKMHASYSFLVTMLYLLFLFSIFCHKSVSISSLGATIVVDRKSVV